MNDTTHIHNEIKAEAAVWLARLRADDRSQADDEAFQRWLAASPAHAAAFDAVNTVWDSAGGLPRDLRGHRDQYAPVIGRRKILAGLGALFVVGSGVAYVRSASARVYQTDVGEQKHVVLEDGSQLFLDTDTHLVVNYGGGLRSADLNYGCADFRISPDANRPFVVSAQNHKITTSHSNFDVRCDADQVSVIVIQGDAVVESAINNSGRRTDLSRGERLVAGGAQNFRVDRPDLVPLLAWQTGQAIFQNEKLTDIVAEMNRYSATKLTIADMEVGNMRLSGVYSVGDNVTFANSVAKLLPIEVRQFERRIDLIADQSR